MKNQTTYRDICDIARDVEHYWQEVDSEANPSLLAMHCINDLSDSYMNTTAKAILTDFLNSSHGWHGSHARRIRNEIRRMLNMKEE